MKRAKIKVRGAVQGVGFRPFVYRLAKELDVKGWVLNSSQGVAIEIEGAEATLQSFRQRLETDKPKAATILDVDFSFDEPIGFDGFKICNSLADGAKSALILPDIAICPDCLKEIFDPRERRYLYPFTNCTNCGPRFSIIENLPYDRADTAMKSFAMCPECEREYHDPNDRRFHAQPIACPACGPHLEFLDAAGRILCKEHEALLESARAVRDGKILALKGIGGFQLIVDAQNDQVVRRLRERKRRAEKPFALLFPSLGSIREFCRVSELEERLLLSTQAPIVLLEKLRAQSTIAPSVAPRNPNLGAMLPCSPLHHLFMWAFGFPVIATSGNVSDEPICIDENEALQRLGKIADLFLVHNRPITRHVDDSVVRVMLGREMVLRAARGYAPQTFPLRTEFDPEPVLAVGAHQKNTVALRVENQLFVSQHIGDLETEQAFSAFRKATADLPRLYDVQPARVACDLHPDYLSTQFARQCPSRCVGVQHHYAHVLSCMVENNLHTPVLGVCWDGTGYGTDGTIWGGEFLLVTENSFERVAHLRQFRLPGGNAAVKQPRRSALGLLYEIFGPAVFQRLDLNFSPSELRILERMLANEINSPLTSSAGRLFDGIAALIGLRQHVNFEGQAAMELEFAIEPGIQEAYAFDVRQGHPHIIDWQPTLEGILADLPNRTPGVIAAKFHNTLAEMIVRTVRALGEKQIALTGGCFQNKYLAEKTVRRLRESGFDPHWHRRIPPNDGGIAPGQVIAALRARNDNGGRAV